MFHWRTSGKSSFQPGAGDPLERLSLSLPFESRRTFIKKLRPKFNYQIFKCCSLLKGDQMATFSKPRDISAAALSSCYPVPALYSRGAECLLSTGGYHAVSILYPWASTQQWPTWESRPGGGINQLPPSLGGLLPAHHAAAPGQALPGSLPVRAGWNSQRWELCGLKSLQRGYISAWKFDMVAPSGQYRGRRLQTGLLLDEKSLRKAWFLANI